MDIRLKNVRIMFWNCSLWTPKDYQDNKMFRYSARFINEEGDENDKTIMSAINEEASKAWNQKSKSMLNSILRNNNKCCYVPGDLEKFPEKTMFLTSHRKEEYGPPILLNNKRDLATGKAEILTGKEGRIYSGCYVNAALSIYAQNDPNSGIRCKLLAVQFCADGEAFGENVNIDSFDTEETEVSDDLV
jgi:hypothetical protein